MDLKTLFVENGTSIQYQIAEDGKLIFICHKTRKTEKFQFAVFLANACLTISGFGEINQSTMESLVHSILTDLCECTIRIYDGLPQAFDNKDCTIECMENFTFMIDKNKLDSGAHISDYLILKYP